MSESALPGGSHEPGADRHNARAAGSKGVDGPPAPGIKSEGAMTRNQLRMNS